MLPLLRITTTIALFGSLLILPEKTNPKQLLATLAGAAGLLTAGFGLTGQIPLTITTGMFASADVLSGILIAQLLIAANTHTNQNRRAAANSAMTAVFGAATLAGGASGALILAAPTQYYTTTLLVALSGLLWLTLKTNPQTLPVSTYRP